MLQEFYRTSIITKFIKYIIAKTPLPLYKYIYDNEQMHAGCFYTYKDNVLFCTKSGRFVGIDGSLGITDYLRVQEPLTISDTRTMKLWNGSAWVEIPFTVTDNVVAIDVYAPAEYILVDSFLPGQYKPGITQIFKSNVHYYDEETHKWLGEYLRYLSNMYDLHLMSLYNCYSGRTVQSFVFDSAQEASLYQVNTTKTKMAMIPIKFDTKYTIAFDCDFPVRYKAVLFNDSLMYDKDKQHFLSYHLNSDLQQARASRFTDPFIFEVSAAPAHHSDYIESELLGYEKYLYLAIELPADNDSTIVALEGDYTGISYKSIADAQGVDKFDSKTLTLRLACNLTLLKANDRKQHPFADRLVEFLVRNTMDTREYIDENITTVERAIGLVSKEPGQWNKELQYILYNTYMDIPTRVELNRQDITGYVDSDIESAVRKGYVKL